MTKQIRLEQLIEFAEKEDLKGERQLIRDIEAILDRERKQGKGKLKNTVQEMQDQENFVDNGIAYLPAKGKAIFVGDLHGDFGALMSILEKTKFIENMNKKENLYLVFLGDYIDRGLRQIETIKCVLELKRKYPKNVILLRGNHDAHQVYITGHDFPYISELSEEYSKRIFEKLPTLLITESGIVAVHAGIPNKAISGLLELKDNEILFDQMRWNDPKDTIEEYENSPRDGYSGTYKVFGQRAFERFISAIGGKVMVRSHEPKPLGYKIMFSDRLISIFSTGGQSLSSAYSQAVARPKFLEIDLEETVRRIEKRMVKSLE